MKYQLIAYEKELDVIIDESAKEDFMSLMGWDDYDWNRHIKPLVASL